jgi:hypothetical protein
MNEPSPRTSRLAIASGLAALIAIGVSGFLLGRATAPLREATSPTAEPTSARVVQKPLTERVLTRADLMQLGNQAADATASGMAMPATLDTAAGQRFRVYLPFGCDGPSPEESEAALRWSYDAEASTLRIRVTPTSWAISDWWQSPPAKLESLEGFWIARPWSSRETCNGGGATVAPPGIDAITLPGQTLGLAEPVTKDTPRQLRRNGKPYEIAVRVQPGALRFDAGFRLRLRGRITTFPEGHAVRCAQPGGREQRPICLLAVSIDEIAIENGATREVLAVWSPTAANAPHSEP